MASPTKPVFETILLRPAEDIVHRAERMPMALIIMGRRGDSPFHCWMPGSISERVLSYAHCPTMVVH